MQGNLPSYITLGTDNDPMMLLLLPGHKQETIENSYYPERISELYLSKTACPNIFFIAEARREPQI